jgi:serine protease Do
MQPATVIARDTKNDLALLSSQLRPERVATMRTNVRLGENIAVYGFPLAGILPSTGNFTLGNIAATAGLRDDSRMLQISAPVQLGNSGGPLLDQDGNVVGVVVGKLNALAAAEVLSDIPQNINFAIKSVVVTTFLEANGVQPSYTVATGSGLQAPDVADRAKAMSAFIVCRK